MRQDEGTIVSNEELEKARQKVFETSLNPRLYACFVQPEGTAFYLSVNEALVMADAIKANVPEQEDTISTAFKEEMITRLKSRLHRPTQTCLLPSQEISSQLLQEWNAHSSVGPYTEMLR